MAAVHVHPAYATELKYDVALVRLSTPSTQAPVELYEGTDVGFTDCHAMTIDALTMQPDLEKKSVMAVDHAACEEAYYWRYGSRGLITSDMLCVSGNFTNCQGDMDLGGPLVSVTPSGRKMLLGVSPAFSLCDGLPVAFTRISEVAQWILAAAHDALSVHPARKLTVRVDTLSLPEGATLRIYSHASAPESRLAATLDSNCQAGVMADDFGSGAMVVEYTPESSLFQRGCDAACIAGFGFSLHVQQLTCQQNFARHSNKTRSACVDPAMGGVTDSHGVGGIRGCSYVAAAAGAQHSCTDPVCNTTLRWPQIGPLEVRGLALHLASFCSSLRVCVSMYASLFVFMCMCVCVCVC